MRSIGFITVALFAAYILFFGWIYDGQWAGNSIVDDLNMQIRAGDFEKIYSEMSENAKSSTPREEFMSNMNRVVAEMKDYDDSTAWNKVSGESSNVYRDLYFLHREMERDGKKVQITVTISRSFLWRFYDLCITPVESTTGDICVTDALRKI